MAPRYWRLDPEQLKAAKKEFDDLEAQEIIRRSSSQLTSPLHMAKKEDGGWILAAMQGLQAFKLANGLLETGPAEGLSSDTSEGGGCAQNCHHHSFWPVQVS